MPDTNAHLPRINATRYGVLGMLSLVAVIAYLQRQLISTVANPMREDLSLDTEQMGTVLASFYTGYALLQIPSGWLADRWGSRRALSVSAVVWSIAVGAMALVDSYPAIVTTWFAAGAAQAGAFPCAASSIRRWMSDSRRAFGSGVLTGAMPLGGALASFVAGHALENYDVTWRTLFALVALPGLVWAAAFWWWFRDTPAEFYAAQNGQDLQRTSDPPLTNTTAKSDMTAAPPVAIWKTLLTSRTMWVICIQQFFRAAGYIFFATWFTTYLQQSRGLSLAEAGRWTSLPLVAVVVGSTVGGIASDALLALTGNRRLARSLLTTLCLGACAVLIMASYWVADARLAVLLISAGTFLAAGGGVNAYAITMDLGGRHVATVFSTMNMFGNLGAALLPYVIGLLLQVTGRWDEVLWLFAGIYAVAAVCWLALDPTRAIFATEDPAAPVS